MIRTYLLQKFKPIKVSFLCLNADNLPPDTINFVYNLELGNFNEASALFCRSGYYNRAMEMYLDLRDWNRAKCIMEQFGYQNGSSEIDHEMIGLLKNAANWLLESGLYVIFNICFRSCSFFHTILIYL